MRKFILMNAVIVLLLFLGTLATGCKKSITEANNEHEKSFYRVLAIGTSTDTSKVVYGRMETVGLDSAKDNKLSIVLLSYQNVGGIAYYTISATNLQDCQMILRWNWDGEISLIDEQPNDSTANTPQSDVLKAYQTKIYTVTGTPKPGRIKVQAQHSNNNCPNSSTLIINITNTILPITYLSTDMIYSDGDWYIAFRINDPTQVNYFIIQRFTNNGWENVLKFDCNKTTKDYKILVWDDVGN